MLFLGLARYFGEHKTILIILRMQAPFQLARENIFKLFVSGFHLEKISLVDVKGCFPEPLLFREYVMFSLQ